MVVIGVCAAVGRAPLGARCARVKGGGAVRVYSCWRIVRVRCCLVGASCGGAGSGPARASLVCGVGAPWVARVGDEWGRGEVRRPLGWGCLEAAANLTYGGGIDRDNE